MSVVLYEHHAPAVVITLNRPNERNALSRQLISELTEAFRRAGTDSAARSIVLAGAGNTFCAGMDLAELQATIGDRELSGAVWEDAMRLATLFDVIYSVEKPTIAVVRGAAVAGGAGLVTVCDLAIAEPHARFGYPEVRRGLVAAMVMPHLLRHVGERAARYLLLTGELINADEACRVGLINEIVSGADLLDRAFRIAHSLAEGGPNALTLTKALLKQFSSQVLSVEEGAKASAAPRLTDECQQGLKAFFAKQPVPWASPPT
jgi:methylglutaconyl-CoA hydratase